MRRLGSHRIDERRHAVGSHGLTRQKTVLGHQAVSATRQNRPRLPEKFSTSTTTEWTRSGGWHGASGESFSVFSIQYSVFSFQLAVLGESCCGRSPDFVVAGLLTCTQAARARLVLGSVPNLVLDQLLIQVRKLIRIHHQQTISAERACIVHAMACLQVVDKGHVLIDFGGGWQSTGGQANRQTHLILQALWLFLDQSLAIAVACVFVNSPLSIPSA